MRVALVAGPDAGHAIPALTLARRFVDAGDDAVVYSGGRWLERAAQIGVGARVLPGLAPRAIDDDSDSGRKIHARGAYIAQELLADLRAYNPDVVVSDILTTGGGMAAEMLGVPWAELSPHPLYQPSIGLPPIGTGLAPGEGVLGRARDIVLRWLTARSLREGERHRTEARVGIGLPPRDPGPALRLIATLPALEVPRPDWPANAHVIGPLVTEMYEGTVPTPPGDSPLVVVAPSTAFMGAEGLIETAVAVLEGSGFRLTISTGEAIDGLPDWVSSGRGRQDQLFAQAAVVVCGGGHGVLSKALFAGAPVVVVPGGGDQWEVAKRVERKGLGVVLRPLTAQSFLTSVEDVLGEPAYARAAREAARSGDAVADPVALCRALVDGRTA